MLPLTLAPSGAIFTIRKITGSDAIRQHLAELGFVVDEEVQIINSISGDSIVRVKDTRVAIGKDLANRIMVS
jgi:ferrous iron transport protein A